MRVLVLAKNSDRFRELKRRSDLMKYDFVFASSPKVVGALEGSFDCVLDYKDAYDNRRYEIIKHCVEAHLQKVGLDAKWCYDTEDLP